MKHYNSVGPVLTAGDITTKIVAAIKKLNKHVDVFDEGSYIRVLVPNKCRLTRQAIEEEIEAHFVLTTDLEPLMPSFKGRLTLSDDEVVWAFVKT